MANEEGGEFIRRKQVEQRFGISDETLRRWERSGGFPKSHRLGPRVSGWFAREIEQWLEARRGA